MKKVSIIGKKRYIGFLLIVMQGILVALLTILVLDSNYINRWNNYLEKNDNLTIHIKNVSDNHTEDVTDFLYNQAYEYNLFIVKKADKISQSGTFLGYSFGICGDPKGKDVTFSFLNNVILTANDFTKLLLSNTNDSTLGVDQGSIHSLKAIPSFRFGSNISVKKLNVLIEESKSINGDYIIVGLKNDQKTPFLEALALKCNVSVNQLTQSMQGNRFDDSLKTMIICVLIIFQMVLNAVYFTIISIRNIDKSGKLSLLGWSRIYYCSETLGQFVKYSIINMPLQIIIGILLSGWSKVNALFISYFTLFAIVNVVLVLIELSVPTIIQLSITPINAIRRRIPKKILYTFGILLYLIVSIATMYCAVYVDSPIRSVFDNVKLSKAWQSVSDYQILEEITVGNDDSSIKGESKELFDSFYKWYKDIYENEGVFLIHTRYYDNNVLDIWKNSNTYQHIPNQPTWYFAFSPNYIQQLHLSVDEEIFNEAKSGTRVYMIPTTYPKEERENLENWIKDSIPKSVEGDIQTTFTKEGKIKFVEYDPSNELFTWNAKNLDQYFVTNPIIYICTPENMTFFELESLRAEGLDGYIKFENIEIAQKYLSNEILEKYKLDDNQPQFTSVHHYIDGLQKTFIQIILWFGMIGLILIVILIGILIALANVFRMGNQEKINVKKFLGYSFMQIYKLPVCLLTISSFVQILIMIIFKSKAGIILMVALACIQFIIFIQYMSKCEIKNILKSFKEE